MIELLIAFGAGLISFLSPCVLPLIPGYISFITGNSLNELLESKKITPKEIIKSRKQFRTSVIVRNIYSEVLNIIQPIVISKLKKSKTLKDKKYLNDSLMTSIAGISAAMKNTG